MKNTEVRQQPTELDLVGRAIVFATCAHNGMHRKFSTIPYILHPMEAASIVGSLTDRQEVIAAAVLHDVVGDTPVTIEEVESEFGSRVAELVSADTEDKRENLPAEQTWKIRKSESVEKLGRTDDIEVKMLFLGDKLANLRAIYPMWVEYGNELWSHGFNESDPREQHWYYRSIANSLADLKDTLAWKDYDRLIRIIFGEEREP